MSSLNGFSVRKPVPIALLPEHIIRQISAGEVIAGPASALKELLDNSLDAGASSITLHLERGGQSLLQLRDNGCGIAKEDLGWALTRHATSKMSESTLFSVPTLGFRGEALASMAAVSDLTLISRTQGSSVGFSLSAVDAVTKNAQPKMLKASPGTTVIVRDLFQNTPARLKFMKSVRSDRLAIKTLLGRYAAAFPGVSFQAWEDGKSFFHVTALPLSDDQGTQLSSDNGLDPGTVLWPVLLRRRLQALWPDIEEDHFAWVKDCQKGYSLQGFLASPAHHYGTSALCYLMVNGRPLKDPVLLWAVRSAFQDVLPMGRFPCAALFLTVPTENVDVNVHPAKEEVRFAEPKFLKSWIRTVVQTILQGPLGRRDGAGARRALLEKKATDLRMSFFGSDDGAGAFQEKNLDPTFNSPPTLTSENASFEKTSAVRARSDLERTRFSLQETSVFGAAEADPDTILSSFSKGQPGLPEQSDLKLPEQPDLKSAAPAGQQGAFFDASLPLLGLALGQIQRSYIVAQGRDGLVIVDQHAAHERVTYERFKTQLLTQPPCPLLVPVFTELASVLTEAVLPCLPWLKSLGLHAEHQGENRFMIYSLPALMQKKDPAQILKDVAEDVAKDMAEENDSEQQESVGLQKNQDADAALQNRSGAQEKWHRKLLVALGNQACKNSIKAGQTLSIEAMNTLLRAMESTPHAGHCNHGRPTYIVLKRKDLDRLFQRL